MVDVTSWLLFASVCINQMGRVMVPAVKTTVLADATMGEEFKEKVGMLLSGVSIVCLGGKLLGGAVTDKLGGWIVLVSVFIMWLIATLVAILSTSVDVFGYAWWLNSFAYTITWGAALQVIGVTYDEAGKAAQLVFVASASRFGATIGNVVYGLLLSAGLGWRQVFVFMLPLQALLTAMCGYMWASSRAPAKDGVAKSTGASKSSDAPAPSIIGALMSLDFWLMLIQRRCSSRTRNSS